MTPLLLRMLARCAAPFIRGNKTKTLGDFSLTGCADPTRRGDYIITYTGRSVFVLDPRPDDFDVDDIAFALANLCRYNGHVPFYSVAEHSVRVASLLPHELALEGLLHDAAEAYIGDLPRPIKYMPEFEIFRTVEHGLEAAIATRFGLRYPLPPQIKEADNQLLGLEIRQLRAAAAQTAAMSKWLTQCPTVSANTAPLACWSPAEARTRFLEAFHRFCRR